MRLYAYANLRVRQDGDSRNRAISEVLGMSGRRNYQKLLALAWLLATPAFAQVVLYNNGPDGNIGYYHANFGSVVANSFTLSEAAMVTNVTLTIYAVDDSNVPEHLKWTITTEPFGGAIKGTGFVNLSALGDPYPTQFQFFAWPMGFSTGHLVLPAGTYYLQIQDIVTRWDTWAFWAQSGDGTAAGYYEAIAQNGAGTVSPVPSETFTVSGELMGRRTR